MCWVDLSMVTRTAALAGETPSAQARSPARRRRDMVTLPIRNDANNNATHSYAGIRAATERLSLGNLNGGVSIAAYLS